MGAFTCLFVAVPNYLWISDNWYKKEWRSARRLKNITMVVEWIPNRDHVAVHEETRVLAKGPEHIASQICDKLWAMFAPKGRLTADALHGLLLCVCVSLT